MFDVIVIGGGISGLTFSHFAKKAGRNVLLLEAADRLGGAIYTLFPYKTSDFFLEAGSHTIYSSYATILEMVMDLGMRTEIIPHKKYPYMFHSDGVIQPISAALISKHLFTELLPGIFRLPFRSKRGLSVKDYYGVLGSHIFEKIVEPVLSAVICQDSGEAAAELLLKSRSKNRSFPRSFTFKGGLTALVNKLGYNAQVKLSEKALSISHRNSNYFVKTEKGEYPAKSVVLAVGADSASKLVPNKRAQELLNKLQMKDSLSFTFAAHLDNYAAKPFAYIISRDGGFRGLVSRDVIPDDIYRGAAMHIVPSADPYQVFNKMLPLLSIKQGSELFTNTHMFSMPLLRANHREWLKCLNEALGELSNFYLAGNFFGGLSMEDCALRARAIASL